MPRSEKTTKQNKKEREEAKKAAQEKFWKQVDEMLMAHGLGTEIAAFFDISPNCLYERCKFQKGVDWSVYSQAKTEKGKVILKTSQFQKAIKEKSCTMQIHLGKHWLGQTDRQVIQTEQVVSPRAILKLPENNRRSIPKVEQDATA
jgi:hypothetical protein